MTQSEKIGTFVSSDFYFLCLQRGIARNRMNIGENVDCENCG